MAVGVGSVVLVDVAGVGDAADVAVAGVVVVAAGAAGVDAVPHSVSGSLSVLASP